jgi:hypothetical protein
MDPAVIGLPGCALTARVRQLNDPITPPELDHS